VTKDRNRKEAIRALAAERGISHQQAARLYDEQRAQRDADAQHDTPSEHAPQGLSLRPRDTHTLEMWDETNDAFGTDEVRGDPYRQQAALDSRALLWGSLGEAAHHVADQALDAGNSDLGRLLEQLATATAYAAILDQEQAARVRFEHRIPTLHTGAQATLLHLGTCSACGRPWQLDDSGACPDCPAFYWGPAPYSRENAEQMQANGHKPTRVFHKDLLPAPPVED
jgi:hypothetical protein